MRFPVLRRALAPFFLVAACASEPTPPAEYAAREAPPAANPASEPAPAAVAPKAEPPAPPPAPPVQVVAGENTPIEGKNPTLKIMAPRANQLIKSDLVEVKIALKDWALSPEGNHVHLIVDNEPYMAVRDADKPVDLRAMMQKELGHDLAEGTHVLRMFPSRGHHESVKMPGAFASVVFHFKKKSADVSFDAKAPLLTFSRPKGCIELGQRALLDFYVTNATLGTSGPRAKLTIDSLPSNEIVSWVPHYIENLPEGEHTLHLELIKADGSKAEGAFNDTTRTIKVQKDCKTPAPAAPPSAAETPSPTPAAAPATPAAEPAAPNAPKTPAAASPKAPVPTAPAPSK